MTLKVLMTERAFLASILPHVKAKDPKLARLTAQTLAQFRTLEARIGLLHLLHHADRAVVLAAIEGLQYIGTVDEIEHLSAFGGWLTDRTLKRAARLAIDAIRERSSGTAGSLSLVDTGDRGALSID